MPTFYNFTNNAENLVSYSTYNESAWSNIFPAGATLTTGISAPDGSTNAVRFTCNNTTNALLRVNIPSFTPNGTDTYTTSFFVRKISGTGSAFSDLQDGSPSVNYSSQLITNQWVRVSSSAVPTATAKTFIDLFSDNNTNLVLDFWGVQIERKSSAGAYVETNGNIVPAGDGLRYSFDDVFVPADIFRSGNLWTWGGGGEGQLGDATINDISTPITVFTGGSNWRQISAGGYHTTAIKTDGTLWSWGYGFYGINGNASEDFINSTPVTTFAGGINWKQVSSSRLHTAAIKTDGTLWIWGNGYYGRLGDNDDPARKLVPITTFAGGTNWTDTPTADPEDLYTISSGSLCSAAIKTDGTLWVWGINTGSQIGQLGTNDTITRSTPVTTFAGGTNWKQVSAYSHMAAIKTDGTLWTWGPNGTSQLGINNSVTRSTPVTTFAGGTNWKQVSCGNNFTAAIKTDGTLWTWGSGSNGVLGNNLSLNRLTPITTFAGGTNWKQVSCSQVNITAIKTDGTLWVWGSGSQGGLGINLITTRSTPVTTFAGGTDWKQVSGTAAIKTDGTLWSWGAGLNGQLGNGVRNDRLTPVTTFAGGTNWKQVSSGRFTRTAIKTDGTLWTWGAGYNGYLGNNSREDASTPVTTFAGGTNWKQISFGRASSIALKGDGSNNELFLWGDTFKGTLGDGNPREGKSTPLTTFAGGTNWKQVSIGMEHSAAIKTDGTLWSWGSTDNGELGNFTSTIYPVLSPVTTFAGGNDWKQVSCGFKYTAAIKIDGTLWTWGRGSSGQLGTNSLIETLTPVTTFTGGTDWKQLDCGEQSTAAIKTDGTLWTWGYNFNGELGRQSNKNNFIATPVTTFSGGTNWADTPTTEPEDLYTLNAGRFFSAAIKTDGTLWVWGNGYNGNLGINSTTTNNASTPTTTFAGGTNWKQLDCGNTHMAAIKTDGTLWTWGANGGGQLGDLSAITKLTPVTTFAGGANWRQVDVGGHSAAIKTDGTLWVWGSGLSGALGTNDTINRSTPVTTFAGGTNWKQVSSGNIHIAAVKTDGTLWVWGVGNSGRLGTNNVSDRSTPVTTFAGGTDWKQVSCGEVHTAAIKTDGTLWTWGYGLSGALGTNDTINRSTPVTTFAGGTNWKQVSVGNRHTAAIKTDGTLWTWGSGNSGILGTNDTTSKSTPVTTFAGGTNWKQVSAGGDHTISLKDDGINKELFVFGNNVGSSIITNAAGVLGIPYYSDELFPVKLQGTNWKQVSIGMEHSAAIKTDGTLWIWGDNFRGKLGTNDETTRSTPVTTFAGGTNWKQISAGYSHTVALTYDDPVL